MASVYSSARSLAILLVVRFGCASADARCSAHKKCGGFDGLCCPSADGTNLGCCDTSPVAAPDPVFVSAPKLTLEGAKIAMEAAELVAKQHNFKVAIAICDSGGIPLMMVRNGDGHSGEEAMGKCQTAALFQADTSTLEAASNVAGGKARTALLSTPWYMMAGGLPFWKDGVCVGSVGVSGVNAVLGLPVAHAAVDALAEGGVMRAKKGNLQGAAPLPLEMISIGIQSQPIRGSTILPEAQVWAVAVAACSTVAALSFYIGRFSGRWNARPRQTREAFIGGY